MEASDPASRLIFTEIGALLVYYSEEGSTLRTSSLNALEVIMATINATASNNRVNRMRMSKARTLALYSDRRVADGQFLGVAQFISRLAVDEVTETNPFTIG